MTIKKEVKLISIENPYSGYLQLYKYNLEIPSLNPQKTHLAFREREVIRARDSVLILLFAPSMDSFIFCQQFRLGVFANDSADNPFILEAVAGTIEDGLSPEETAIKEVYEETGLRIHSLKPIAKVYKTPGLMTEKSYLYYAEVQEQVQSGLFGLEDEGEEIRTHVIFREKVYQLMDEMKINDSATLLVLNWFRANANYV